MLCDEAVVVGVVAMMSSSEAIVSDGVAVLCSGEATVCGVVRLVI